MLFVVLLGFTGFSGFFSSSETAMFSLNSVQLEQMRQAENPNIGLIERLLHEPQRLIITMEEVVEDLEDEYDRQKEGDQQIQRLGEKEYIVSARIELDELCERLKINLPKGRYAGLILQKTHSVPPRGTTIQENGISLSVHRSTARAVMEVRICW